MGLLAGWRCGDDTPQRPPSGASDLGLPEGPRYCAARVDCPTGEVCSAGVCVPADAGVADAQVAPEDATTARDVGTTQDLARGDGGRDSDGSPRDARPGPDAAGPDAGQACAFDTDCPMPYICGRAGVCVPACLEDRDCAPGQVCHRGGCRAPGAPCLEPQECLPGEICHMRRCRPEPECIFADDCAPPLVCVDGACQQRAGAPDGGAEEVDGGAPDCPARAGRYGDECECSAQCTTEMCLDIAMVGRTATCTRACDAMTACPHLDLCVPVGASQICVPNDAGQPCRGAFDCLFGCLSGGDGEARCTAPCADASGCPQGWGCSPMATDAGVQRFCVPAGGLCAGAVDCAGGRCMPRQAGDMLGYCTLDCGNAWDCPQPWSCCAIPDAQGYLVRVCVNGPVCPAF